MRTNHVATVALVCAIVLGFTARHTAWADGMSPTGVSPDLLSRSWSVDPGALPSSEAKCIAGEWPAVRGTSDAHPEGDTGQRELDFARAQAVAPVGWDGVWYYISGTPTEGENAGLVGCISEGSLAVLRQQAIAALGLASGADAGAVQPVTQAELDKAVGKQVAPLEGRVAALEGKNSPTSTEFNDLKGKVEEQGTMLTDHEKRLLALEKALSITGAFAGVQATALPMNHRAMEWVVGARPLTFIPHTRGWVEWSGGKPIRAPEEEKRPQTGAGTLGLSWRVEKFPIGDLILEAGFHRRQFQDADNWADYQLSGGRGCANWAPPLWSWVHAPDWAEKTEGMVSVCLEGGNATDFKNIETTHVGGSVGLQGSFGH